jgi:hypothetical protein
VDRNIVFFGSLMTDGTGFFLREVVKDKKMVDGKRREP